jgi:hypothetical protein
MTDMTLMSLMFQQVCGAISQLCPSYACAGAWVSGYVRALWNQSGSRRSGGDAC